MTYIFGTINFAHLDTQVFEDFLIIFLGLLKKQPLYHFSVEKDNSPSRHLHFITKARDTSVWRDKLKKNKSLKPFQEFINSKNTETNHHAVMLSPLKEDDYIIKVGYIFKEGVIERCGTTESQSFILDAVQQYFAVERTKAAIPKETHFKVLSSKTLVPAIMDHLSKHEQLSISNWTELKASMNSHGYLFYDISESKVRLCVQELKAHYKLCDMPKTEDLDEN